MSFFGQTLVSTKPKFVLIPVLSKKKIVRPRNQPKYRCTSSFKYILQKYKKNLRKKKKKKKAKVIRNKEKLK